MFICMHSFPLFFSPVFSLKREFYFYDSLCLIVLISCGVCALSERTIEGYTLLAFLISSQQTQGQLVRITSRALAQFTYQSFHVSRNMSIMIVHQEGYSGLFSDYFLSVIQQLLLYLESSAGI